MASQHTLGGQGTSLLVSFSTFIVCVHVPWLLCTCGGQKIIRRSWFSPSTMWIPGRTQVPGWVW